MPATDAATNDNAAIRAVVTALYESISFDSGEGPDFDRLTTLFAPGAHLIEVKEAGTEIIDLASFIDHAMNQIRSGRITRFDEREVWQRIEQFGHIAHVLSTYEARDLPEDDEPMARGINSIQLLKDQEGWRVVSILWQNEGRAEQIPPAYLPDAVRPAE